MGKYYKLFTGITIIFIFSYFIFLANAYAYLDPGSGSFFFQIIIATVLGLAFAVKIYWRKILGFLGSLFPKRNHDKKDNG